MSYYANVNPDLLAAVPLSAARVLEVGCGAGNFAQAYRARNPSAFTVGVELHQTAAEEAAGRLHRVIVGDIEQDRTLAALDQICAQAPFDALVLGDVLEHLHDPWQVLAELRRRVAPGGTCAICIPNVSHWSLLTQQLRGRWDYADTGLLDRTHLRFFTLATAAQMLEQADWTLTEARPRVLWPEQTQAALKLFEPLAGPLGIDPANLRRDLSAFQWVLRAVNGIPRPSLHLAALGLRKVAGVTEARVDQPLAALATLPDARVVFSAESLVIPEGWPPGVLVLHRQFLNQPGFNAAIDRLIAKGWVVVSDMDDDPHHWPQYAENRFLAFRGVHAVTVSTEPLAEMMRQWTSEVQVFPNAVFELPHRAPTTPKQDGRLRVCFAALRREADWDAVREGIMSAVQELADAIELVVVHDRAFFDALPTGCVKEFHPTLPHGQYMQVLAGCDLALLPMADTPFNRLKSDLKFIECCAAGAVPICSPVVYGDQAAHRDLGRFAETPAQWHQALIDACADTDDLRRRRVQGEAYVSQDRMHAQQAAQRDLYYRGLLAHREELEILRQGRL